MNRTKKTMMFLGLLISYCFFFNIKVDAISEPPVKTYTIDHDKDAKKAQKWAEKEYTAWKKALSYDEKNSLARLLQPL